MDQNFLNPPPVQKKNKWPLVLALLVVAIAIAVPILFKKYQAKNWNKTTNQTVNQNMTDDYTVLGNYNMKNQITVIKINPIITTEKLINLAKKLHSENPNQEYAILDDNPPDLNAWKIYQQGGNANSTQSDTQYILTWDQQHYVAFIGNQSGKSAWKLTPGLGGGVLGDNSKFKDLTETAL